MNLRTILIALLAAMVLLLVAWPYIGQTEPTIDPSAFQPVVVPTPPIIDPPPYIPEPIKPPPQPDTQTQPTKDVSGGVGGVCPLTKPTSEPSSDGDFYRRGLLRRWR